MMAKLSREHAERHAGEVSRCLKMCEFQVFPYTCVEMSGGLTDIASCTAYARKFINHTRSESIGERGSFTLKRLPTLKEQNANTMFALLQ